MQFVTGDGRPLRDVPLGDFDIELLEGFLEQPSVGEQLFSRFGRGGWPIRFVEQL